MYVCVITVYDLYHIGHADALLSLLTLSRAILRFLGYKLKYVRNIADIDDKIIKPRQPKAAKVCRAGRQE